MEGRDSYERTDNYNAYGLFCYFALRMRQDFSQWTGMPTPTNENILVYTEFVPTTHEYTFELFQPLLNLCMPSKSETIKAMAFETAHMLAYQLREQKKQFGNLCLFQTEETVPKQMLEQLFTQLGE